MECAARRGECPVLVRQGGDGDALAYVLVCGARGGGGPLRLRPLLSRAPPARAALPSAGAQLLRGCGSGDGGMHIAVGGGGGRAPSDEECAAAAEGVWCGARADLVALPALAGVGCALVAFERSLGAADGGGGCEAAVAAEERARALSPAAGSNATGTDGGVGGGGGGASDGACSFASLAAAFAAVRASSAPLAQIVAAAGVWAGLARTGGGGGEGVGAAEAPEWPEAAALKLPMSAPPPRRSAAARAAEALPSTGACALRRVCVRAHVRVLRAGSKHKRTCAHIRGCGVAGGGGVHAAVAAPTARAWPVPRSPAALVHAFTEDGRPRKHAQVFAGLPLARRPAGIGVHRCFELADCSTLVAGGGGTRGGGRRRLAVQCARALDVLVACVQPSHGACCGPRWPRRQRRERCAYTASRIASGRPGSGGSTSATDRASSSASGARSHRGG